MPVPIRWLVDEDWWRDATSNAAGTGIALFVAGAFGVATGILKAPNGLDGAAFILFAGGLPVAMLIAAANRLRRFLDDPRGARESGFLVSALLLVAIAIFVGLVIALPQILAGTTFSEFWLGHHHGK